MDIKTQENRRKGEHVFIDLAHSVGQTGQQTDGQTGRQTSRQIDNQADIQAHKK